MSVKVDILEGSRGKKTVEDGWVAIERTAIVTGVTGSGQARLDNALTTLANHDPSLALGGEHPHFPGLFLDSASPEPAENSPSVLKVRLSYVLRKDETAEPAQITVGTAVQQEASNTDRDDKVIYVDYYDDSFTADAATDNLTITAHGMNNGDSVRVKTA